MRRRLGLPRPSKSNSCTLPCSPLPFLLFFLFLCNYVFSEIMERSASPEASFFSSPRPHLPRQRSMSNSAQTTFKFAGIQLAVGSDKTNNVENARAKIKEAAAEGANVIALPVRHAFFCSAILVFELNRNVLTHRMETSTFHPTRSLSAERQWPCSRK